MKVLLDVGSNTGQTLDAVMERNHGFRDRLWSYDFDRIHSFEPVPSLQRHLAREFQDPRITFNAFGLWKETVEMPLFSPGSEGASIFADKINVDASQSLTCSFVRASDWFSRHLAPTDTVFVKLNCEGAEADIIDDLLTSGEYGKVRSLAVTFDVKKIPSQRHREAEVKRRLAEGGYANYVDINTLGASTFRESIRTWLDRAGAADDSPIAALRRWGYHASIYGRRAVRYGRRRFDSR